MTHENASARKSAWVDYLAMVNGQRRADGNTPFDANDRTYPPFMAGFYIGFDAASKSEEEA